MMRWMLVAIVCFLCAFTVPAFAAKSDALVIDLAEDHVDITTGFNGSHLVVFGAKKKAGDLVVELRGPKKMALVRKKNSVLGAWMNTRFYKFPDVWSYYDYALSAESFEAVGAENKVLMRSLKIGINPLFFASIQPAERDVETFQKALLRTKQKQGFYPVHEKRIKFLSNDLFRAEFYLPPSVPKGEYQVVASLMRGGQLVDQHVTSLRVRQVGMSSYLNRFAYDYAFAYGLICICIAFFSGWAINALRRGF